MLKDPSILHVPIKLPDELQIYLDAIIAALCSQLVEEIPNALNSPEMQRARIKTQVRKAFEEEYKNLMDAAGILKETFQKEDELHPEKHEEDAFSLWEEHQKRLKKQPTDPDLFISSDMDVSLQERLELPWIFLDRVYNHALSLLQQKKFNDAVVIFQFLKHLNPSVFEYWLGEATCHHELGNFEKALSTYNYCLPFNKFQPLIQYQIANCYKELKDNTQALEALKQCFSAAEQEETNILDDAHALQDELSRKSA